MPMPYALGSLFTETNSLYIIDTTEVANHRLNPCFADHRCATAFNFAPGIFINEWEN